MSVAELPVTSLGAMMRRLDQESPRTWIYFIQEGASGAVKIGKTTSPRARLHVLRNANPRSLRLIGLWWAPEILEKALHDLFVDARLRGEWFEPTVELLRFAKHPAWHREDEMEALRS